MKNLKADKPQLLIIGVGNTSRGDDALGWDFVAALETEYSEICDFEYRYQLQVEDSELISFYENVVIIDASHEDLPEGFEIQICRPAPHYYFSSHAQKADTILYLSNEIYGAFPTLYTMAISGYQWELDESTSAKASQNFVKALEYFRNEFTPAKLKAKPAFSNIP